VLLAGNSGDDAAPTLWPGFGTSRLLLRAGQGSPPLSHAVAGGLAFWLLLPRQPEVACLVLWLAGVTVAAVRTQHERRAAHLWVG
jgi:hypothetical protein